MIWRLKMRVSIVFAGANCGDKRWSLVRGSFSKPDLVIVVESRSSSLIKTEAVMWHGVDEAKAFVTRSAPPVLDSRRDVTNRAVPGTLTQRCP